MKKKRKVDEYPPEILEIIPKSFQTFRKMRKEFSEETKEEA